MQEPERSTTEGAPADPAGEGHTPRSGAAARTLLVGLGLALVVLGVGGVLAVTSIGAPAEPQETAVVQTPVPLDSRVAPDQRAPLPDMTLEGFDGGPEVALADYRGRPLVVNFWATWCAPCIEEMPDLEQVARELEGRVAFLGVNVQDAPANAAAFAEDIGVTYDLAADPRGELYQAVEAFGMPTTLLVTPKGEIVYRHTGLLDAERLRALVERHLGVPATASAGWRLPAGLG